MKKLSTISILLILAQLFYSCGIGLAPRIDFDANRQDFALIAERAQSYFTESLTDEEQITLDLAGDTSWLNSDTVAAAQTVEALGFDFLWVSSDCVIFWEDEAKTYGLLYADSPRSVIKELREWYTQMDYNKIEKYWYEIGQLTTI